MRVGTCIYVSNGRGIYWWRWPFWVGVSGWMLANGHPSQYSPGSTSSNVDKAPLSPVHTSNNVEATLSNATSRTILSTLLRYCCWCGGGFSATKWRANIVDEWSTNDWTESICVFTRQPESQANNTVTEFTIRDRSRDTHRERERNH